MLGQHMASCPAMRASRGACQHGSMPMLRTYVSSKAHICTAPAACFATDASVRLPQLFSRQHKHHAVTAALSGSQITSSNMLSAACRRAAPTKLTGQHSSRRATSTAAVAAAAATTAATIALPAAGTAGAATAATVASTAGSFSFNQLAAVLLGWICLAGSCFRSVPQITKIMKARSAEGLSLTSIVIELLCYTVNMAYNINHAYPFNTYGDVVACWLQNVVIIGLIVKYRSMQPLACTAATLGFTALSYWMFCGGASLKLLGTLQCSNIAFTVVGVKLPQIVLNIQRGNTGLLSRVTCLLNVLGNLIRVFTTLVLTRDPLILASYSTMLLLNGFLLVQTLMSAPSHAAVAEAV